MPHFPLVARAAGTAMTRLHCMVTDGGLVMAVDREAQHAIADLAASYRQLVLAQDGEVETKSEAGNIACTKYLDLLALVAERLHCESADRSYRHKFTNNYRILFPDTARRYRTDVLEACVERLDSFYVNGDLFRLSNETLHLCRVMQLAWSGLGDLLKRSDVAAGAGDVVQVKEALCILDEAWARFENEYILELIKIEESARSIVVKTVECERRLQHAENQFGKASHQAQKVRQRLAAKVAHLNSVANATRKGRDDLGVEVLERAYEVLEAVSDPLDAAHAIASQVVSSFHSLRTYFRHAQKCLERIDPYLGHNVGLAERLCEWEESWEVGSRYLRDAPLQRALSASAGSLREIRRGDPRFAAMCEDCDVELFLVLPRLLWLAFLERPADHVALLRSIVPDLFCKDTRSDRHDDVLEDQLATDRALAVEDRELEGFMNRYRFLKKQLAAGAGSEGGERTAYKALIERAISEDAQQRVFAGQGRKELQAVHDFMRELEGWSMTLQRHCPDQWNSFAAVILKVLGEGAAEPKKTAKFRI